ncbi:MAG: hypothetical protein ACFB01_15325 [Cohaesibacteraceae bacterium]
MRTHTIQNTPYKAFDYAGMLGQELNTLPYALRVLAENSGRHDCSGEALSLVA